MILLLIFFGLVIITYLYAKWHENQGFAKSDRELLKKDREELKRP